MGTRRRERGERVSEIEGLDKEEERGEERVSE